MAVVEVNVHSTVPQPLLLLANSFGRFRSPGPSRRLRLAQRLLAMLTGIASTTVRMIELGSLSATRCGGGRPVRAA